MMHETAVLMRNGREGGRGEWERRKTNRGSLEPLMEILKGCGLRDMWGTLIRHVICISIEKIHKLCTYLLVTVILRGMFSGL